MYNSVQVVSSWILFKLVDLFHKLPLFHVPNLSRAEMHTLLAPTLTPLVQFKGSLPLLRMYIIIN